MQRRRPRRLQLDDGRVGPAADGAGGVQLRRGDAAVPGRRRGARAATPRHAILRLLGMHFIDVLSFCIVDLQGHSKVRIQGCVNSTMASGGFR